MHQESKHSLTDAKSATNVATMQKNDSRLFSKFLHIWAEIRFLVIVGLSPSVSRGTPFIGSLLFFRVSGRTSLTSERAKSLLKVFHLIKSGPPRIISLLVNLKSTELGRCNLSPSPYKVAIISLVLPMIKARELQRMWTWGVLWGTGRVLGTILEFCYNR